MTDADDARHYLLLYLRPADARRRRAHHHAAKCGAQRHFADRFLLGVAGLYLLQHAEFLFAVQIVLYIGGIMVLFLFVIMLVNLDEAAKERQFNRQWLVALACVARRRRADRLVPVSAARTPSLAEAPQPHGRRRSATRR